MIIGRNINANILDLFDMQYRLKWVDDKYTSSQMLSENEHISLKYIHVFRESIA